MELLGIAAVIGAFALALNAWKMSDWVEARADEAAQRARKLCLENDLLEIEVDSKKSASTSGSE